MTDEEDGMTAPGEVEAAMCVLRNAQMNSVEKEILCLVRSEGPAAKVGKWDTDREEPGEIEIQRKRLPRSASTLSGGGSGCHRGSSRVQQRACDLALVTESTSPSLEHGISSNR